MRKPIPAVPVAQFEAFKVYEDKQDGKCDKTKRCEEKEEEVSDEVISIPKESFSDSSCSSDKDFKKDSAHESPMSIDRSIVLNRSRQLTHRKEREIFFEMPEYRRCIHKYLREAEVFFICFYFIVDVYF